MVTVSLLLMIVALILFGLVAFFGVNGGRVNLVAAAFFCLTLAMLLGNSSFVGIFHH